MKIDPVPWRWIVLDSKGNPCVQFPTKDKADEYAAKGYVVFPVYRELPNENQNTNDPG